MSPSTFSQSSYIARQAQPVTFAPGAHPAGSLPAPSPTKSAAMTSPVSPQRELLREHTVRAGNKTGAGFSANSENVHEERASNVRFTQRQHSEPASAAQTTNVRNMVRACTIRLILDGLQVVMSS